MKNKINKTIYVSFVSNLLLTIFFTGLFINLINNNSINLWLYLCVISFIGSVIAGILQILEYRAQKNLRRSNLLLIMGIINLFSLTPYLSIITIIVEIIYLFKNKNNYLNTTVNEDINLKNAKIN